MTSALQRFWAPLLVASAAAAQPQSLVREELGYRIELDRVVAEDAAHWRQWEAGSGTRVVEEDGTVRPRLVRANIDATENAIEFMNIADGDTTFGGISDFGTIADSLTVESILDRDLSTWWEPDTESLDNAWVEIDLGRTVIARRIRVRFADSGDPFLMFRVLVSDGTTSFGRNRTRRFFRAGQVAAPNKNQREFVFDLAPRRPVPDGVVGEPVQFVRIDLLGTDGPRAEQIEEAAFVRLPPEQQGAIDYFRVTVAGREIPVERESYELLAEEQRGPVLYYRKESPRLAEVEVEALGDNIVALTQRLLAETGVDFFNDLVLRFTTDGLLRTGLTVREYSPFQDKNQLLVDLGGRFWIDRLRLISDLNPLTSYQVRLSDGSLDAKGGFIWDTFDERLNAERYLELEETFAPRPVRLIELRRLNLLNDERLAGKLNELQAYGEGYVSDVVLTSPLIKFDGREMVTGVDWDADVPLGTRMEIRTRSGDEVIQIPHYLNSAGREISEQLWERLPDEQKGPIRVEEVPDADWSTWSEPYLQSGLPFQSPSPRKMALMQVRLRTFQPLRSAQIRRLQLRLAPPLVDAAVAEVTPRRGIQPGVERNFTLYLRVDALPGDPGFDQIRLRSSAAAPMTVTQVAIGTDDELRFDQAVNAWPELMQLIPTEDGVLFELDDALDPDGRILQFDVRTSVFLPSTTFSLELIDVESGRVQLVDTGDATSLISSSQLVVISDLQDLPFLAPVQLDTPVLTPNGDGINDQVRAGITVFQLEGQRQLRVELYDVGGRRLRDLSFLPSAPSGEHQVLWDGRDESGQRVAPGIYLLRVDIPTDADAAGTSQILPIAVAY